MLPDSDQSWIVESQGYYFCAACYHFFDEVTEHSKSKRHQKCFEVFRRRRELPNCRVPCRESHFNFVPKSNKHLQFTKLFCSICNEFAGHEGHRATETNWPHVADTWKHKQRLARKSDYLWKMKADRIWYHPHSGYAGRLKARFLMSSPLDTAGTQIQK